MGPREAQDPHLRRLVSEGGHLAFRQDLQRPPEERPHHAAYPRYYGRNRGQRGDRPGHRGHARERPAGQDPGRAHGGVGLLPPLVVQMVAIGEETGDIDVMLAKVSDYYDREVEYSLRNLSTMIEPILLLAVGGIVLFLALGIFLPMWDMIRLFKK